MPTFIDRLSHAWNAFMNKDPTSRYRYGDSYGINPMRRQFSRASKQSVVAPIFNRIAMDAAAIDIKHVRLDEDGRYTEDIKSRLNDCLTLSANLDQTGRAFRQDAVMSLLTDGCIAIVPVDTTANPTITDSYDIGSMRVGKIESWYPNYVSVELYNEKTGNRETINVLKRNTAIIENPLYETINEPNSIMQRLLRKLALLDAVDEQSGSGKMDLIIQLPYAAKTDLARQRAEKHRKEIETQLTNSKYGVAYIDSTEHITQLNRPLENNLMHQVEYLTSMLYSQLGITEELLNGSADDKTTTNYYSRIIEPIMSAIVDEMKRKFLSKTARSQLQSIEFFRSPFKLVPVGQIAEMADKFTRNEIMTSNEFRQVIGMKPSKDPKADQLMNSNISQPNEGVATNEPEMPLEEEIQNGEEV